MNNDSVALIACPVCGCDSASSNEIAVNIRVKKQQDIIEFLLKQLPKGALGGAKDFIATVMNED